MKASELTIGSLVRTNKGKIIKVESISTKRQHRKLGYHDEGDPYHIKYVRITQAEPIPITEDMLIANGFDLIGESSFYKRYKLKGYGFPFTLWCMVGNDGIIHGTDVCYYGVKLFDCDNVHQLQHVLRMSEQAELADNFKIL